MLLFYRVLENFKDFKKGAMFMDAIIYFIIGFVSGAALGVIIMLILNFKNSNDAKKLASQIYEETQVQKNQEIETILNRVKDSFGALSLDVLSKNSQEFLKVANEVLSNQQQLGKQEIEGKKQLIDQTLNVMKEELTKVETLMQQMEKERESKYGMLTTQLRNAIDQTNKLQEITGKLQMALANSKARGNWGERMAEDVLRLSGFIEGINYFKQKTMDTSSDRPDYTFMLPQKLKLNMDVKFPLDNYLKYLDADDSSKELYKKSFLQDVNKRIDELKGRNYINPEENTVDYVLMFIPNEQVYSFINEVDRSIIDNALRNKVIICSPITLYAILAIIRQAVENFSLEKTAGEILGLLSNFRKKWDEYQKSVESMGKKLDGAVEEYSKMIGTKKRDLDKQLQKIDEIRQIKGFAEKDSLIGDMTENINIIEIETDERKDKI